MGTRRIGLARTDLLRTSVNPAGTCSPKDVFSELEILMNDQPVLAFVVGWPLSTSGELTQSTQMVQKFIRKLEKKFPGIPVFKIDERYSSQKAVKKMIEAGVPRKKRSEKGRVDQAAAALILQQFLETNNDF